ncbi:MAG: hypothetical protein ACD_78C00112G0001, partial [uncultured bacterium (gcode 4)]
MKVVDDDEVESRFNLESPRLGFDLEKIPCCRIIDIDICFRKTLQSIAHPHKLIIFKKSFIQLPAIHSHSRADKTIGELFLAHLEGEYRDVFPTLSDVLCDIEGERSLTHGRSCREYDHIPWFESSDFSVETLESCMNESVIGMLRILVNLRKFLIPEIDDISNMHEFILYECLGNGKK